MDTSLESSLQSSALPIAENTSLVQPVTKESDPVTVATDISKTQAALSGLKRIVERIKNYPQRYTDDSGAQFIRDLYDRSPDKALDFFARLEKEGFRVNLTPEENQIMENIRPKTSPLGLLPQARIIDGAKASLTRRNLLRKGAVVMGALAFDQMNRGFSNNIKEIGAKAKDLRSIEEELEKDGLSVDKRDELAKRREDVRKSLEQGAMGKTITVISDNKGLLTAIGIIGIQFYKQGADVVEQANLKANKVIDFVSSVIDHKMGYTIVPPASEQVRS